MHWSRENRQWTLLASLGGGGGGRVARVGDVGQVELEVVAGACVDIDCAAGTESLGTGAKDQSASGVALRPRQTHLQEKPNFISFIGSRRI